MKRCLGYNLHAGISLAELQANADVGGSQCGKIHVRDKCKYNLILHYVFCLGKMTAIVSPFIINIDISVEERTYPVDSRGEAAMLFMLLDRARLSVCSQ